MASKVGTKVVNIMGVLINKDGSMDEFVVPRHTIKLNSFNPKCLEGVCEFEAGEGPISLLAQMEFQQSNINIFAWEKGEEKNTNKYDYFPPPIDNDILYGSIFVFRSNRRSGQVQSLTSDLFERYIETCHRGFEDLGSDDSDDDSDEEEIPTQEDIDFIANDDDIEDDASISDSEGESTAGEEETDEEAEEDEGGDKAEPEFE